jgi:hypothetical protein
MEFRLLKEASSIHLFKEPSECSLRVAQSKTAKLQKTYAGENHGCQIFHGGNIPKQENIPNDHKLHIPNGHIFYQMAVKHPK